MSGFNATPEDVNGIPIASVVVPGNKTPVATKGGPATTDSQGNPLAGVSMYGYTGDIVDLATLLTLAGTPGDANTVASLMGRLTKIRDLLNATLTVGGSVSVSNLPSVQRVDANSGDFPAGAITDLATLLTLSGTPTDANTVNSFMGRLTKIRDLLNLISYDNTTEIKVSMYGTNATPGDTALGINASGNLKTNINGISGGVAFPTNADTAIGGTTAPSKEVLIGGKTNDGTPQYQPLPEGAGGRSVIVEGYAGGTAVPVSGTFWQGTQPVSAASLPLPTGAATSAKQPALGTAGTPSADVLSVQGVTSMTPLKTDGSGVTQPVSAASLPLPTGAATSTKQPALGTAGAASSDVISVQGVASMTPIKVDGSGVTQPVSAAALPLPAGASTSAKQPALGTAGSASTDVLSVQGIASMTPLKTDGSGVTQPVSGTFWQTTQPVSAASLPLPTGAAQESGGNLATLAGIVSSSKAAVKAGAGDFADLASLLTAVQGVLAVKRSAVAVYSLASTASSGATGNSGDLTVGAYTEISIDINMTTSSGTAPTVQFFWDRKGADGVYYPIYQSTVFSTFSSTTYLSTAIGAGMAYNQSLGTTGRLRWVIGGSATPTVTFSANVQGK